MLGGLGGESPAYYEFLHAALSVRRPGAVAEPLRGVREALAPEKIHLNGRTGFAPAAISRRRHDISTARQGQRKDDAAFHIATSNHAPIAINKGQLSI